jgi:serine/threonine-protein kinase
MVCPSCQTPVDPSQRFCPACGTVIAAAEGEQVDPFVGQILMGKYKVVRLLGEGGMGAVYEGEQALGTTTRKVAVKTLHAHLSKDPKIQARFQREVGTLAGLQHPNTIQVFDFDKTPDGILYIVMEFLQGKSLADALEKEGAMQPERAANIIRQVCGSLEEAHQSDIVHRDLKPDNIVLIERAGQKDFVKVLDFGIAKRSKEEDKQEQKLTQQGMVLGTPPYMSPEQFTGQPIDRRSDIYSLGVMAYEMLTGRLPFRANTAWEWATQHMTQQPIPIETMAEGMRAPENMRATIRKALAKSPDERFQTVKEFGEAFSGGGTTSLTPSVPDAARQRTEVGAPLDVSASFGGSSPAFNQQAMMPGAPPPPVGTAQGYTPVGGNVAFPTPAGIPQPPPPAEKGGGGNRAVILIVAGVIAVGSLAAIGFAMRGSGGSKPVTFANTSSVPPSDPSTVLTGTIADPGIAVPSHSGALPPLTTAAPHPTSAVPHPTAAASSTIPGIPGIPAPPAIPSSIGKAPPYDGIECQRARAWRATGRTRAAEQQALLCIAKGGQP